LLTINRSKMLSSLQLFDVGYWYVIVTFAVGLTQTIGLFLLLQFCSEPLRPVAVAFLSDHPLVMLSAVGNRSFTVAGPRAGNTLPEELTSLTLSRPSNNVS